MGDIAAYLKNEKLSIDETKLTPLELSELIASIKNGTISGKIGKEVTLLNCFGFFFLLLLILGSMHCLEPVEYLMAKLLKICLCRYWLNSFPKVAQLRV
jgi:hypothetical protein